MGMSRHRHDPPTLRRGKDSVSFPRKLGGPQGRSGWVRKVSPSTGTRSSDRPARRLFYIVCDSYLQPYRVWNQSTSSSACLRNMRHFYPPPLFFRRPNVKLKNNDYEAFSCFRTFSLVNASDKCLPLWTLL